MRDRADEIPEVSRPRPWLPTSSSTTAAASRIHEDAPFDSLLSNQNLRRFGALMAVDAEGRLSGVITAEQVGRALPRKLLADGTPSGAVALDDAAEVGAGGEGAEGLAPVAGEAGGAERVGGRLVAVADEQRALERDRHPLDDAPRPRLDRLEIAWELGAELLREGVEFPGDLSVGRGASGMAVALQGSLLVRYGDEAAARLAQAHEFVEALPEGYDTVIGERGITLSGGQRQRVAIARALVVDPRILILDDATASVDATTESKIRDGLREAMRNRTTIIIAHRLSTIALADEIVVVDDGRIVFHGSQNDARTNDVYREIEEHGMLERIFVEDVA